MSTAATHALRAMGRDGVLVDTFAGARSGAEVHRIALSGRRAVLKLTTRPDALPAARRELACYQTLSADLPVRVPTLVEHLDEPERVALLLSDHGPPTPAAEWGDTDWIALADDLARLHEVRPSSPDWQRPSWVTASWQQPDLAAVEQFWCRPGELELLHPMLGDLAAFGQASDALPPALLHGDCHADNVLLSDGALVWVDWQAVGVSSPAAELAFPSVRGVPDGARLPMTAMLARYADRRGLDVGSVTTATVAAELLILVLTWPAYAGFNTVVAIDRVHARVAGLMGRWRGGEADR